MSPLSRSKQASIEHLRACIAAVEPDGRVRAGEARAQQDTLDTLVDACASAGNFPSDSDLLHATQESPHAPVPSDDPKKTFEGTFKKVERLCLVREQSSLMTS